MDLEKIGKLFTSKFVGTGPSSYKKRIYRAVVSQSLRKTALADLTNLYRIYKYKIYKTHTAIISLPDVAVIFYS